MNESLVDIGLYLAYILVGTGLISAIIFPLIYLAKHPAESKKSLIGVGALIVVFLIAYLMASGTIGPAFQRYDLTESMFKMVGAGLNTLYILGIIGVAALIYSEVSTIFK